MSLDSDMDLVSRLVCDAADIQQNRDIFERVYQFIVRRCNAHFDNNGGNFYILDVYTT